jgi:Ca-activated chloride channel family protein
MTRLILAPLLASLVLTMSLGGSNSLASQVQLNVSMANPTLLANKKQTTFIKIGLTGFKMKDRGERTPVNVSIVLDKSGSMSGNKLAKAKAAAIAAIGRLGKQDIVSIVVYDSTVQVVVPATKMTDKKSVIAKIRQISSGGSTALFAGVSKGAAELRKFLDKNRVNRMILLSDGLANVGPKSPSELGDLGASLMKEGISVTTMGLGLDYNEDLMTRLAQKSSGNHLFIENADDLVALFNHEFDDVLSVVAQEVVIDARLAPGIRPVRTMNVESEITGQRVIVKINQLYSEQEKYALLEIEVPPGKVGQSRPIADVKISYANMQTKTTDRLSSSIQVVFSKSVAEVEKRANVKVKIACVLQIANKRNELATALRDKGDVEGARKLLIGNGDYLRYNAELFLCPSLETRAVDNYFQSEKLSEKDWQRNRKAMREQQNADLNSQKLYKKPEKK